MKKGTKGGKGGKGGCKRFAALSTWAAFAVLCAGCAKPDMEPLERTANKGWDTVQQWSVKGQSDLSTRTLQMQGGVQGINPLYRFKGMGGMFNGFIWDTSIGVEGVAGQLQGATQADQGPDLKSPDTPVEAPKPPEASR